MIYEPISSGMKKQEDKLDLLLLSMSKITRMERGKICRMKGRPHYNHQTWENGKNVVRYVPASEVEARQEAIDGYRLFMELAEEYAQKIILRTRAESKGSIPPGESE